MNHIIEQQLAGFFAEANSICGSENTLHALFSHHLIMSSVDHRTVCREYPSPDNSSLVPVIYRPHSEGGVQLIQLNLRNFVKLKDFEYITEDGPIISLYDKIKALIGFKTGRFEIEEAWKATAPDVLLNPVLRAHQENEQHEQAFERQFENWWNAEKDGA